MKLAHHDRLSRKVLSSQLSLGTPTSSTTGSCQCDSNGPSGLSDAVIQRRFRNASLFRPFPQCQSLSVVDYAKVLPCVSTLLQSSRPPTIRRAVRTVVVAPIQGCTDRAWPHVCGELFKARLPRLTHGDSTSTVPLVLRIGGIQTTPLHDRPDPVEGRSCLSVRTPRRLHRLGMQTAAALGLPLPQGIRARGDLVPTVAATAPTRLAKAIVLGAIDHDQPSKALPIEGSGCNHPLSVA
jgi:hypothetical protein